MDTIITNDIYNQAVEYLNSADTDCTSSKAKQIICALIGRQDELQSENEKLSQNVFKHIQERDYLKDMFDNQPAGIYRIRVFKNEKLGEAYWASSENPPYVMEFFSPRVCEILGVSHEKFQQNLYILGDLVHHDDKESFHNKNVYSNNQLTSFKWEGRLVVNGKICWVSLESYPKLQSNGDIVWTGALIDITEHMKAELSLKESEEKYRQFFLNNPRPMWLFDLKNLNFVEVNNSAIRHYGYSRKEFLKMSIQKLIPTRYLDLFLQDVQTISNGKQFVEERNLVKKNGEEIIAELIVNKVKFNHHDLFLVVANDITFRKEHEESMRMYNEVLEQNVKARTDELNSLYVTLKQAEQKLRNVADYTYNWEYWISPENEIIYMSPSVERITGFTVNDFLLNPKLLNQIVSDRDIDNWNSHTINEELNELNTDVNECVFRINTKNNEIKWIAHVCRRIYNNDQYLGIRVSNRDVTESIEAKNELLKVTVDVEERERNKFARELHDGLGPILSTIKLYFQLLAENNEPNMKSMIYEKGNKSIEAALQTTRELTYGLNSQFLIKSGYIYAIRDFVRQINETKKIKITLNANTERRFNIFFETNMYRITTELIKNSLTHSKASEIDINFNFEEGTKNVKFLYYDNGVGFDSEKVLLISKGIGLASIQQRVNILKGDMLIESAENCGFKVVVDLKLGEKYFINR